MAPTVDGNKRVRLLHELLRSLLGANTSSLPMDVVELVASLFRILRELEVRVPSLKTHFHVSGVSKTTGQSFFVIIRDDALDKSGSAKRVIRSVYTYLHGEASMLTTASAWEQSRDDDAGARTRALLPGVVADAPADASAAAAAEAAGLPVAATGAVGAAATSAAADARNPAGGIVGVDPERPPAPPRFGPELDALNYDPEGDAAADAVVAGGTLPPHNPQAVGGKDAQPAPRLPPCGAWQLVMAPRYEKPTLHRPTPAAKLYVEALFDASKGFAGVLRSTMAKVRLKVLVRHGLASNANIMLGLHWWPKAFPSEVLATLGVATSGPKYAENKVDEPQSADADAPKEGQPPVSAKTDATKKDEPSASANADAATQGKPPASANTDTPKESETPAVADSQTTKRGNAVSKCTYEVFPVLMEKRHLPTNERARDAMDTESVVVHLSQIGVARQPGVSLVATALTLLFDKEPCVKGVMDAKLAEYSKWVDLDDALEEEDGLKRVTVEHLTSQRATPPRLPRAPPPPPPPPLPDDGAAVDDAEAVVRARVAARQAAAAASQDAADADKVAKTQAAAERRARKRSGTGGTANPSKRARQDGPTSALIMPSIKPAEDVVCLPLLVEASMLADHTYETLATNWCQPVSRTIASQVEVEVVSEDDWREVVRDQDGVECVLGADVVQSTRKRMMEMAEVMRAGNEVDPDKECPIVATAVLDDPGGLVRLSMASIKAMGDLHLASARLYKLRAAATWMEAVAGLSNSRVPDFMSGTRRTTGALATDLMRVVLAGGPTAKVWRSWTLPTAGGAEDVVVPAHLLVSNMGTTWMSDDVLFATLYLLQRLCTARGEDLFVLHCSVFARLLHGEEAGIVDSIAVEVHGAAGKATRLAGICNINGCHWVAYCIDLTSKTLTQYDSGAHFVDLLTGVDKAAKRVKALGKALAELKDMEAIGEGEATAAEMGVAAVGDVESGVAGGGTSRKKIWSTQKVKTPQQPLGDNYSCGPLAFSFVWHWARGEKSRVQPSDADAIRLAMLSTMVLEGVEQEDARVGRAASALSDDAGAAI